MHEVGKWVATLATLVGFALTMGTNPALYGATADMLARRLRAYPRLSWMAAGLFLGATVLFAVLQTFNPTSFVNTLRDDVDTALLSRNVDLAVGAVLILLAAVLGVWKIRVRIRPQKPPKPPATNAGALGYFLIGLSGSVIGFTPLPIMYLTGQLIADLSPHAAPRIIAYLVFLVALGGPYFALAWVWHRFPRASQKISNAYTRALRWDYRSTLAVIFAISGAGFIVFALLAGHR